MTPRRQRGHIIHSRLAALVSADPDARKRVRALRRALAGSSRCTFLVQNDPDPDAIASARNCASETASPSSTTVAPYAPVAATFTNGVVTGITMVAGMFMRRA